MTDSPNELEKRLRELLDGVNWTEGARTDDGVEALVLSAARIGAELEREECARDVETMIISRANVQIGFYGEAETFNQGIHDAAALIRSRGAK
jgi:hypothetical protein